MSNVIKIKLKKKTERKSTKSSYLIPVKENLETPIVELQFNSVIKPIYFPGTTVPRYRICVLFDLKNKEHTEFLGKLEKLAVEHEIEKIGKLFEGKVLISCQGREKPKIFILEKNKKKPKNLEIDHDMPVGVNCKVKFTANVYLDRRSKKNAFNFSPLEVIYVFDEKAEELMEME
jgi:hypothetical protein